MDISNIENKLINHEVINNEEIKFLLDYIIASVRNDVDDKTFEYKCDMAQGLISDYLNKLDVENHPCSTNHCVHMNSVGHSFVVAIFGDSKYIVDPAFVQFYYHDKKYKDLWLKGLRVKSMSPYYYASKIDNNVITSLMKNGYMELNEHNAFVYANAFYKTITGFDYDGEHFIEGETFINSVLKENDELHFYNSDSIEVKSSGIKK